MIMPTKRTVRILLVEDDEISAIAFQRYAGRILNMIFDVTVAVDLESAVTLLQTQPFDIVFLDLNLPNNDADHTIAHIAINDSHVPVVILTSTDDKALEAIASDLDFKGYITKGDLSPQVMEERVSSLIA